MPSFDFQSDEFFGRCGRVLMNQLARRGTLKTKEETVKIVKDLERGLNISLTELRKGHNEGNGEATKVVEKYTPYITDQFHEVARHLAFYGKPEYRDVTVREAVARLMTYDLILSDALERIPIK